MNNDVFDGEKEVTHSLNRSYYGLYVTNGIWRRMENFSTNAFALCIASTKYDEQDYIRDRNQFLKFRTHGS